MQFEETERFEYTKDPLQEVMCQLRFPTILRIDEERPVELHEAIREDFPYYECVIEYIQNVEQAGVGRPFPDTTVSHADIPNHTFESQDHLWRVNLTSNFMTLTTRAYTRWEDFRARFEKVLSSFAPIYLPPFFSRIGLRYIDAINKDALGLHELNWSELLRIPMLGMLGINDGEGIQTTHCIQQSELALDDFRTMVIRTGLGTISGDANQVFIIDTDTFIARDTVLDEVPDSLDALHEPVSRYFRWAVTDTLHSAMEPRKLEG